MIKAVPDIEDARVAVASSGRRVGFGQKPRVTANVTVKPRAGRDVSARLVGSLRQAVASMVPDLLPADVTVFDVAKGQAYSGEQDDDPLDGRLLQRVREFTRQYEQQIQKALTFIPNATVAVHVDLDNLKSSVVRKESIRVTAEETTIANRPGSVQPAGHDDAESIRHTAGFRGPDAKPTDFTREVSEHELLVAMPRAVQVSVAIPRDYYRDVAARRKVQGESNSRRLDLDSIEEEVLTKVERTVGRLIPVGSPHNAVSVTTVDRMPTESVEPALTTIDQFTVLAWRHGGSITLGLLVVWALWMLSRLSGSAPVRSSAMQTTHQAVLPPCSAETPPSTAIPPQSVPEPANPTRTLQDEILGLSGSDPATTATEITRELLDQSPDQVLLIERQQRLRQSAGNDRPVGRIGNPSHVIGSSFPADCLTPTAPADPRDSMPLVMTGRHGVPSPVESGPFDFLNGRHPDDVLQLLHDEQPQTIAVIAAQLPPAFSAAVLAGLTPDRQADVLQRVARLGPTDPEILADIAAVLKERLGRARVRGGGVSQVAAVLRESSRTATRSILATMEEDHDSNLAGELRQTLFSFDDLLKLDDDTLRVILQETDDRQWALALKASPVVVRQKVLGCLSDRVARAFQDEMDSLGPVRLSEMTSVRQQIADSIHRLEEAGLIALPVNS